MAEPEAIKTSKVAIRALEEFPTPSFSDWNKASEKELKEHVQELRLYMGLLLMSLKEMREVLSMFTDHEYDNLVVRFEKHVHDSILHMLEDSEVGEYDDTPQPNNNLDGNPYK